MNKTSKTLSELAALSYCWSSSELMVDVVVVVLERGESLAGAIERRSWRSCWLAWMLVGTGVRCFVAAAWWISLPFGGLAGKWEERGWETRRGEGREERRCCLLVAVIRLALPENNERERRGRLSHGGGRNILGFEVF